MFSRHPHFNFIIFRCLNQSSQFFPLLANPHDDLLEPATLSPYSRPINYNDDAYLAEELATPPSSPPPPPPPVDDRHFGRFEVTAIHDMRTFDWNGLSQVFYLVEWEQDAGVYCSWEPIENLTNCRFLLNDLHRTRIATSSEC